MPMMPQALMDAAAAFGLVAIAELGDKSQLVCMGLAARHRAIPVLAGAVLAFALLNLIAVLFGASLAHWLPPWLIAATVAVLFAVFGIRALLAAQAPEEEVVCPSAPGYGVLLSTSMLIFVAEFGDKTQLAVAGLAGALPPLAIWAGATAGLALTSLLGVTAGRTLLQRLPQAWIHRLSAVLFLGFAVVAAAKALNGLG